MHPLAERVTSLVAPTRWLTLILGMIFAVGTAGCGNSTPAPVPEQKPELTSAENSGAESESPTLATTVDPDHPETKWIGTIPYDVFYDQPLQVAADSTAVATATTSAPPAEAPMAPPAAPAGDSPPSESPGDAASKTPGEVDWAAVAPMSFLVDEVKQIRVRLERNLQKISDFNKNVKSIAQDGAMLAAIAGVVERHSEEVNWKDKAANIRDLANEIYIKAEGSGSKPYNATKKPFEDLKRLLDGESPAEPADPTTPLAEVADRGELMKQLNETYNSLKSNVNSADRLKEDQEKVHEELAIMTLLMTVMADPSYDRADDPRYQGFVDAIVGQQQAAAAAGAAGNFDDFSSAIGKINISCNECHMIFRTASE